MTITQKEPVGFKLIQPSGDEKGELVTFEVPLVEQ